MRKKLKNLFIKVLLAAIKGIFFLPSVFVILNDTFDTYSYAADEKSYSIIFFVIIAFFLLLDIAIIIFTKFKLWKILGLLILSIIYMSMHLYSKDVIYSGQVRTCLEGNYNDCGLKEQFEEP